MDTLDGRTALVSGGASGIGYAIATNLRTRGVDVLVVDRDEGALQHIGEQEGWGTLAADVGIPDEWDRIASLVSDRSRTLDFAFLNAGIATGEWELAGIAPGRFDEVMRVNAGGVFWGVRALHKLMSSPGGSIVATASVGGLRPVPLDPVYAMSKHAVIGLVRSVAPQLADRGVRINAICPAVTDTPMVQANPLLGSRVRERGMELLAVEAVAVAAAMVAESGRTGQAFPILPGRPVDPFAFPEMDPAP